MVVEAVSREGYESFVDNHVLAPIGIPAWEVDAGRSFAADQNPREPFYSSPLTVQNVFSPSGPSVSWPYGALDLEKSLAYGGLIASSKAIRNLRKVELSLGQRSANCGQISQRTRSIGGVTADQWKALTQP